MTTAESTAEAAESGAKTPSVVLKLGGSVITDKEKPETVDTDRLVEAAAAIRDADVSNLVIVHGGGSFGHPAAKGADVAIETGTRDTEAIREIHAAMGRLNGAVLDALAAEEIPAVPVRPFSAGSRNRNGDIVLPTAHLETMLEEGFVPVLHGDVIVTAESGATIVSGDELVVSVAEDLEVDAVGLCTTVPGVLDENETVIPEIHEFEAVREVLGGSSATDVTGGMAGKVRSLLELDTGAQIFDLAGLEDFLAGATAGTRIDSQEE
ncbi:isopentenyl phosphate kinase [Halodesulfurarchaeum sp.]|uniref:isopentenyl phosphate kinase n=1 Tax=Halodesulfurarchaeum sp. TaxID=1980530 RepID=UPI002FC374BC